MARSPQYKVYDAHGEYLAATKRPEEAAAVVALLGDGSTIRYGHTRIVWTEGKELARADESYDEVARTVTMRIESGLVDN